jgi:hypothetical protein
MTDLDLVARLAEEADLASVNDGGIITHWNGDVDLTPYLVRFAALVAEHCAKEADKLVAHYNGFNLSEAASAANVCSLAIRRRFVHSPKPLT